MILSFPCSSLAYLESEKCDCTWRTDKGCEVVEPESSGVLRRV